MPNFTWLSAVSADWLTAVDWSGGAVPNDTASVVTIAVAGSYSVGIAAGETIAANSVTLAASGANLAIAGTLALGGAGALLNLQAGVLKVSGSIKGGILRLGGGTLAGNGGTLDGVSILGTLAPTRFQPVSVVNGLSVQTLAGGAPGSIDLTAGGLSLLDSETLDHVAITLGSPFGALRIAAGSTLTLGPAATLTIAGGLIPDLGGVLLVNHGQITVNADPQGFGITIGPSLLNAGSIALGAGSTNQVNLGGGFSNSGSIGLGANAVLRAANATASFANTGTIALSSGATLELDQNTTLSDLLAGTIDNQGGLVILAGTVTLGTGTLDVAAAGAFSNLALSGTVKGGVLAAGGGVLALPGATLDGVSVQGALDLSNPGAGYTVTVKNGLTAIGPASIDARSDTLSFAGSATLDNLTVTIGQTAANFAQLHFPASGLQAVAGGTITLGAATVVTAEGSAFVAVPSLVNHGSLVVAPAATLAFGTSILVNSASVSIGAGGKLSVATLANSGSITLDAAGTLEVDSSATLPQLIASIGSIDTSGGQLVLGGTIDLLGGTLNVAATGLFSNLVLTGTVKNGTLVESGGTLTMGAAASQFGVTVVAGPTLDGVVFAGTLDLGGPTKGIAIKNGLTVRSVDGGSSGTINLSGGQLTVLDTETLDNLAISLGAPGAPADAVADSIWDANTGAALALGAGVVVTATGNATVSLGGFTNLGLDVVGATQQQWIGQTIVNAGVVTLAGGGLLLSGSVSSSNSGSISASGNSGLNLSGAPLANTGLLQAADGTLSVGAGLTNFFASTLSGGTYEADAGATLDLSRSASVVTDAAAIVLDGAGSVIASFNASSGTFQPIELSLRTITAGHTLAVLGGRDYTTGVTLSDSGALRLGGGVLTAAAVTIAAGGSLAGTGVVVAGITNSGTIIAQGGLLTLGAIGGGGALRVDPGGTLELGAATAETLTFNLSGGALLLDSPSGYTGTLSNFAPGDTLLLANTNATGAAISGNTLNVTLSGGGTLHYTLLNPQPNAGASVTIDGAGLAEVSLTPPPAGACFLQGTRMLTTKGECPIEELRVGDEMFTLLGQRLARVAWVGSWRISCARHARPWDVYPVRVQAGAFGEGRPHRDLFLSPDHAVFSHGVLIPIRYLLNGATVAQVEMDHVTYWHVELDRHDVLIAAGMPAESYLDTGNRGAFDGAPGTTVLHPDFSRRIWAEQGCAKLVTDGPVLASIRRLLLARAAALGHVTTTEPALRLLVRGQTLHPSVEDSVAIFALPPRTGKALLVSRVAVPAELDPGSSDRRPLGVAVTRLCLDGCCVVAGDHCSGWYAPEAEWRWTDGAAELDCGNAAVLEVTTLDLPRYWAASQSTLKLSAL